MIFPLLVTLAAAPTTAQVKLTPKAGAWSLPATVQMPASKKPVPCIAFFAGSGPTDRDWVSPLLPPGTGSAKLLADALQKDHVGTLRFDKVGSGTNMQPLEVLSLAHYLDEAELAFDTLAKSPECGRVYLLGHSEGAMHALSAAVKLQQQPKFGGYISMSGPSRTLLDTAIDQIRAMHQTRGDPMQTVDAQLARFREAVLALPMSQQPEMSAIPEAAQLWAVASDPRQAKVAKELMTADPLAPARAYHGRALVLAAANDAQVPTSDADALFTALGSDAKSKSKVVIPAANHVFRKEGRAPNTAPPQQLAASYQDPNVPLAPGVAEAIAKFVR